MGWGRFIFLFLFWGLAAAGAVTRYDLTPLAFRDSGRIALLGGHRIHLPLSWQTGRVFFEDPYPGANWAHPARFLLVGPDGATQAVIPTTLPPKDLASLEIVSGPDPHRPNAVEFKIQDLKGVHKVADPSRYWALLLNGSAEQRHWNDFSFLHRVLTGVYGYLPSQILVADTVFKNKQPDLDGNGTADIGYGSTLDELKTAIAHLKTSLKKGDRLLLVINDHGGREDGESTVFLYDQELKASAFAALFQGMAAEEFVGIYEQCYAGGFVRPLMGPRSVGISAATDLEVSWASVDFRFDEFLYHFISAVAFQRHDGTPVLADQDGNGKVTLKEAYLYASGADKAPESPFLEASPNSGLSLLMGIGF